VDPTLYRPAEVHQLLGDATRANRELGWTCKTTFHQLVHDMLAADLEALNVPSAGVMAG
jgi:GDPmannose 4,6-dehydratase